MSAKNFATIEHVGCDFLKAKAFFKLCPLTNRIVIQNCASLLQLSKILA